MSHTWEVSRPITSRISSFLLKIIAMNYTVSDLSFLFCTCCFVVFVVAFLHCYCSFNWMRPELSTPGQSAHNKAATLTSIIL
jgi:hypothetical protein